MCRKNQLCGSSLITFGVGILLGNWLSSGFLCFCMSFILVILGFWCAGKK